MPLMMVSILPERLACFFMRTLVRFTPMTTQARDSAVFSTSTITAGTVSAGAKAEICAM